MEQVLFYFSGDLDEFAPEPAIRSRDTGQRIPSFDSCQLTLVWIHYQVKYGLQAPTLARKFDISYWFSCGADGLTVK